MVSLYDSYGKDSLKYIMNHAEIKALFLDTFKRLKNILEILNDIPHLKLIVYFDTLSNNELKEVESLNSKVKIVSFLKLLVNLLHLVL